MILTSQGYEQDTDDYRQPGRYCDAMSVVLDYIGEDGADETTGSVDYGVHVMRYGRRLLTTDDMGFVDSQTCSTVEAAKAIFDAHDAGYSEWLDREADNG